MVQRVKNTLKYYNIFVKNAIIIPNIVKINSEESRKIKTNNSNSCEEKEIFDNEDKTGLIKEGFGKFMFNDGTEFCAIFHNNILKDYGKFSNVNQKNIENNNNNKNKNNNTINKKQKNRQKKHIRIHMWDLMKMQI